MSWQIIICLTVGVVGASSVPSKKVTGRSAEDGLVVWGFIGITVVFEDVVDLPTLF